MGGLNFLYGVEGFKNLISKIYFNQSVQYPFQFLGIFSTFPKLERETDSFLNPVDSPSSSERKIYEWILENTPIDDCFLTFQASYDIIKHNPKFVLYTGRFAPGFLYGYQERKMISDSDIKKIVPEIIEYDKVIKSCEPAVLKN